MKKLGFRVSAFFVFSILLSSCNLSEGATQGKIKSTETLDQATSSPEPPVDTGPPEGYVRMLDEFGEEIDVPIVPRDIVDVLFDRLEVGEITMAEGVIDSLKFLVGETPFVELYGDEDIRLDGVWRLSGLALQVYEESDDDAVKAELERLMNLLVPSSEVLDAISIPADQAGLGSDKVASISPPLQSADCDALFGGVVSPDPAVPVVCLLYDSFTADGHEFRVYYPEEFASNPVIMEYAQAALEALQDSYREFSPLSDVNSINVIFSLADTVIEGMLTQALVPDLTGSDIGSACPISVFPAAIMENIEVFKQILAHEVFHCVQFWVKGTTGGDAAAWYIEGMAEYFSNEVYPTTNAEYRFVDEWNSISVTNWLFDMSYQTTVFFQFLGNTIGNVLLIELLSDLPATGNKSQQASTLASQLDMRSIFHEFGQAVLNDQVEDTGGGMLPTRVLSLASNRFTLAEGLTKELEAKPFHISRYFILYKESTDHVLMLEDREGEGDNAARRFELRAWGELPAELSTPCDVDVAYVQLLTTVQGTSNSTSYTRHLEVTEFEESDCDDCLIGTWQQSTDEIRSHVGASMSGSGAEISSFSGTFTLFITKERQMLFTPQDYKMTLRVDDEEFTSELVGVSVSTYRLDTSDEDNKIITGFNNLVEFIITITIDGVSSSVPIGTGVDDSETMPGGYSPFGSGVDESPFRYECTDTTLTAFITDPDVPFSTSSFSRISTIPDIPEDLRIPEAPAPADSEGAAPQ